MAGGNAPRTQRADGRRNRARIVAAARQAVADQGAHASLEHIARQAAVGSATLHRHFPSRQDLLEAVFHDHVEQLCARAEQLGAQPPPGQALRRWLEELTVHTATTRGLAISLTTPDEPDAAGSTCYALLRTAAATLLSAASAAGAVRADISADDLLDVVNAVSLTRQDDGPAARHLLALILDGIARPPVAG